MIPPEENLACIVNNAAGDYFITAKDTNDLAMSLSLPGFDTTRLDDLLRRSKLDGFFGAIARTLRASCALTDEQEQRLSRLPARRSLEPSPRDDAPDWTRRCLGTAVHAFGTRRAQGLAPALRVAANAYSYYRQHLKLSLVPDGLRRPAKRLGYNAWTCIRLVPVDLARELCDQQEGPEEEALQVRSSALAIDPGIERCETSEGTYVRIDGELFIATVDYQLAARLIRHVAALSPTVSR
jgi:hypothetical protein